MVASPAVHHPSILGGQNGASKSRFSSLRGLHVLDKVTERRHRVDLWWQKRCWKVSTWLIVLHNSPADSSAEAFQTSRASRVVGTETQTQQVFAPNDESRQKVPWHKDHYDLENKASQGHDLYLRLKFISWLPPGNNCISSQTYCSDICSHMNKCMRHVPVKLRKHKLTGDTFINCRESNLPATVADCSQTQTA